MTMPSDPAGGRRYEPGPGTPYDGPEPGTREYAYPQESGMPPGPDPGPGPAGPHGYAAAPSYPQRPVDPRERYREEQSSFADDAARFSRQHLRTPETKEFFKTSEFVLTLVAVLTLIISAAVQENFDAPQMWRLVTAIVVAYIVSRGIAKAGTNRSQPGGSGSSSRY
ncbi:MAG TPA: hypothetical protein VM433_12030 [Mycobacteriales bacterium]|nr:hypothetical protein [Mycobacteriales bacterium]